MKWNSIAELVAAAQSAPIWKVILEDDLDEITPEHTEEAIRRMQLLWDTMKKTVAEYEPNQHSLSGLSGGDGARYAQMADTGKLLCDNYLNQVIATALNRRMQRLHETYCCGTDCWFLRCHSSGSDSVSAGLSGYHRRRNAPRAVCFRRFWHNYCRTCFYFRRRGRL